MRRCFPCGVLPYFWNPELLKAGRAAPAKVRYCGELRSADCLLRAAEFRRIRPAILLLEIAAARQPLLSPELGQIAFRHPGGSSYRIGRVSLGKSRISVFPGSSGLSKRAAMRLANNPGDRAPDLPMGVLVIAVSSFGGRTMRVATRGYCMEAILASASTARFAAM